MDERTKELVTISASVAGNGHPRFRHLLKEARGLEVDVGDIQMAIGLANRISNVGG